jgi:hypothetical protein
MGCRKLQLSDYFQVVNHYEVHEVGFMLSRMSVPPRQN